MMKTIETYRRLKYGVVDNADKLTKICEEYNITPTTNIKTIKEELLKLIDAERQSKTKYTQKDAIFFLESHNLYWFSEESSNFLAQENRSFVEYLANFLYTKYNIERLLQRENRGYADDYIVNAYKNCIMFLQEKCK